MKIITVPSDHTHYPAIISDSIMTVRMKLGTAQITLSYREFPNIVMPVLVIEFYNEKGKLYSLRYNLPPDTPERTSRRVSLLLLLIEKEMKQDAVDASAV